MTLLTIINDAQGLLNLPVSTTVVANTGQTQKQLLALANMEGKQTADEFAWQRLIVLKSFTTTATAEQTDSTADLPTDLGWIIHDTMFNRTTTLQVRGPINPREWEELLAIGASVSEPRYRIYGNSIWFNPAPTAGQTCYYEYVSTNWCETSGGTGQARWAADTDVSRLPDSVMTLGIVWRWKQAKGLDYAQDFESWESAKMRASSRDGTRRRLSITGPSSPFAKNPGRGNIPEGSWT